MWSRLTSSLGVSESKVQPKSAARTKAVSSTPVQQVRAAAAAGSVEPPPPPFPASAALTQQLAYGLSDEDYGKWKATVAACKANKSPLEALQALTAQPKLLNYRSPVTGQGLLHVLAASGADDATLEAAVRLGCESSLPNVKGETCHQIRQKRSVNPQQDQRSSRVQARRPLPPGSARQATPAFSPSPPQAASSRPQGRPSFYAEQPRDGSEEEAASRAPARPAQTSVRKKGYSMKSSEVAYIPRAQMKLSVDVPVNTPVQQLQEAMKSVYGERARVQIDEVEEYDSAPPPGSSAQSSGMKKKAYCRIMFDDAQEARQQTTRSSPGDLQQSVAQALRLDASSVGLEAEEKVSEVDAITLKLDSDSSQILCGACLVYDKMGLCESVVHYSSRSYCGVVQHSGDTQVDGKSVHTISVTLSKLPEDVDQLYFTLCACGPQDLSGFRSPSIMLYDRKEPDANLLEYSIEQAANSASCVMARMFRQPVWKPGQRAMLARTLRQMRMPLLCIDITLALAQETDWSIQALGTEEWHLTEKVCMRYEPCKQLIQERMAALSSSGARTVDATRV